MQENALFSGKYTDGTNFTQMTNSNSDVGVDVDVDVDVDVFMIGFVLMFTLCSGSDQAMSSVGEADRGFQNVFRGRAGGVQILKEKNIK